MWSFVRCKSNQRWLWLAIFSEEGVAEYYLPEGRWIDLLSAVEYEGVQCLRESVDYFSIPLLVRENTLLALGSREDRPDYHYRNGVTLYLCGISVEQTACCTIYNHAGDSNGPCPKLLSSASIPAKHTIESVLKNRNSQTETSRLLSLFKCFLIIFQQPHCHSRDKGEGRIE